MPTSNQILGIGFLFVLLGLWSPNLSAQSADLHLILESKWAKHAGKDVSTVFLVPVGKAKPIIFLASDDKLGGGNVVKWTLSKEDGRTLRALLKKGKEIRVISADNLPVNAIKDKNPKGFAVFNMKDLRGGNIRARELR